MLEVIIKIEVRYDDVDGKDSNTDFCRTYLRVQAVTKLRYSTCNFIKMDRLLSTITFHDEERHGLLLNMIGTLRRLLLNLNLE